MAQQDPFCSSESTLKTIFYETEHFMVLYDIRPVVMGHCLFVPKRHIVDILELTPAETKDLYGAFMHVIPKMLEIYQATEKSYDITSQVGPYSGRSVPHLHIHLLPRKKGDKYQQADANIFEDIKLNRTNFTYEEVMEQVVLLRKEFRYKEQRI